MSTGKPSECGSQELLQAAAEQLALTPQASSDEIRSKFLTKVAQEEFVPSPGTHAAFAVLNGRGAEPWFRAHLRAEATKAEEKLLSRELGEYAAAFFSMAPPLRRCRMQTLTSACKWSARMKARLERLHRGLDIEIDLHDDSVAGQLARYAADLFTTRPAERANRRFEIIQSINVDDRLTRNAWREAARRLLAERPALAGLAPDLLRLVERRPTQVSLPVCLTDKLTSKSDSAGSFIGSLVSVAVLLVCGLIVISLFPEDGQHDQTLKSDPAQIELPWENPKWMESHVIGPSLERSPDGQELDASTRQFFTDVLIKSLESARQPAEGTTNPKPGGSQTSDGQQNVPTGESKSTPEPNFSLSGAS